MNAALIHRTAQVLAVKDAGHVALAGAAIAVALAIAAGAGAVLLTIFALVSVVCSRLGGGMKLIWVVLILCAPVLGSLAWFAIGRRDAGRRAAYH